MSEKSQKTPPHEPLPIGSHSIFAFPLTTTPFLELSACALEIELFPPQRLSVKTCGYGLLGVAVPLCDNHTLECVCIVCFSSPK